MIDVAPTLTTVTIDADGVRMSSRPSPSVSGLAVASTMTFFCAALMFKEWPLVVAISWLLTFVGLIASIWLKRVRYEVVVRFADRQYTVVDVTGFDRARRSEGPLTDFAEVRLAPVALGRQRVEWVWTAADVPPIRMIAVSGGDRESDLVRRLRAALTDCDVIVVDVQS